MKAWPVLLLATLGCAGSDAPPGDTAVSYHQDVAPLLSEHCVACHQEGGIGPMDLSTPEKAAQWSEAVALAVENRTMPPFYMTDDGSCQEWQQGRWLNDDELQTFRAWADAGAPEGDPEQAADLPGPVLPELGDEDIYEVVTPTFTPVAVGGGLAKSDEYRCFELQNPTGRDVFLTGYDVIPGNAAIMHHVIGHVVDMEGPSWSGGQTNRERAEVLSTDGRDGWPCFSGAGDGIRDSGAPINWAPGQGAVPYPNDIGLRLGANESLVVQMHYNLADPTTVGQSDQTTVRLRLEEDAIRNAIFILPDEFLGTVFTSNPEVIPPGEEAWTYDQVIRADDIVASFGVDWALLGGSVELHAVLPHMHERGTSITMDIINGSDETCAAEVRRWDFNWQRMYFYEEPFEIVQGDELHISCTWNTEGDTEPVLPGWGTRNEMCLMGLVLVP